MSAPIEVWTGFLSKDVADAAFKQLQEELAWIRHADAPRSEYYANRHPQAAPYTYGRGAGQRTYQVQPSHELIWELTDYAGVMAGAVFDACFLNRYLGPRDQLGWHSDNSPEMDDERPIAVVSLGAEREILFRKIPKYFVGMIATNTMPLQSQVPIGETPQRVTLTHGSLLIMSKGMQDTHQHRIPKSAAQCGERISLTMRGYVPQVAP